MVRFLKKDKISISVVNMQAELHSQIVFIQAPMGGALVCQEVYKKFCTDKLSVTY